MYLCRSKRWSHYGVCGGWRYSSTHSYLRHWLEMSDQIPAPATLPLWKELSNCWNWGWVSRRSGLDFSQTRKAPNVCPGFEPRCFRCPTCRLFSIVCVLRSNSRNKSQDCAFVATSAYCTGLLWLFDVWYWALWVIRHSWKWGRCVDCVHQRDSFV
jgi:hypothetical protein